MRQLSDILTEKSNEVGGFAALGRMLGGLTGQAIGQYIKAGGMPSLAIAIKWKEVFGENLIDLMTEEKLVLVEESNTKYGSVKDELSESLKNLNETVKQLRAENDRLAKLLDLYTKQAELNVKYTTMLEAEIKKNTNKIKALEK